MRNPANKAARWRLRDRPVSGGQRNFGYRVSRYQLDLQYKVAINRLSGTALTNAFAFAALRGFTPDFSDTLRRWAASFASLLQATRFRYGTVMTDGENSRGLKGSA
ncbi:hypothetical protein AN931_23455 [Mycobacterium intracellulare subsp. chimaera]|nr:hypothetical protein AN480_12825 [Mycobacterium intracellulare subsp. chimaera]ASL09467.1 peptidase M1, membrane alanine aminopeptidase [Mycobacterium intracellulare subsp. chimaera]ASL21272.1 peptidase M1, membrane alanine aminopeptidase [Mycobacterium intracellulare subsp. chimaera]ASQ86394.1 hypothetical protein CE197_12890 [Mycobacterium intracellulare subsp. chimaera]KPN44842.1 hypothetical protein AN933_29735 [Mycobacterium intracellulare subsp. chimaera]